MSCVKKIKANWRSLVAATIGFIFFFNDVEIAIAPCMWIAILLFIKTEMLYINKDWQRLLKDTKDKDNDTQIRKRTNDNRKTL